LRAVGFEFHILESTGSAERPEAGPAQLALFESLFVPRSRLLSQPGFLVNLLNEKVKMMESLDRPLMPVYQENTDFL